jgi:peptidoglycan/LPS O-acetylase OafA/YrhL
VRAYRADIDGLRALAVLSVVAFHIGVPSIAGGFTGVDVFFVISGYLLTGILMRELDDGQYSLTGFYVRRARRILPAVTVVVLASLLAGFYLMAPSQFAQTANAARGVATISANMYFARIKADYWDQSSLADQPLLHTWSLAVEEQFYVGLPLLLWLTYRLGTAGRDDKARARRMVLGVLVLSALASIAYAQYLLAVRPGEAFYLVLPRAWELLIGSLLAIWLHGGSSKVSPWLLEAAGWLGFALVVASITLLHERMPFPGVTALLPCLGAALIIWSGSVGWGSAQKLLSVRPLAWIGKVSYSLYLWHWPILVLVNSAGWYARGLPHVTLFLQLAAMLLLAWLSWRFVEQPFRRGHMQARVAVRVLAVSATSLALLWGCGAIAEHIAEDGYPIRMPTPQLVLQLEHDRRAAPGIRCEGSEESDVIRLNGGGCLVGSTDVSEPLFVLLGDSHARMYTEGLAALMHEHQNTALIMARSSCVPVLGLEPPTRRECLELTRASIDFLTRSDIPLIALAGYWIDLAQNDEQARLLKQGLDATVLSLRASGKQVALLMDVPELHDDRHAYRAAIQSVRDGGGPVFGPTLSAHAKAQHRVHRLLNEVAEKHDLMLIDPTELMCGLNGCLIANQGRALYRDRHHITDDAAVQYKDIFKPLLD